MVLKQQVSLWLQLECHAPDQSERHYKVVATKCSPKLGNLGEIFLLRQLSALYLFKEHSLKSVLYFP